MYPAAQRIESSTPGEIGRFRFAVFAAGVIAPGIAGLQDLFALARGERTSEITQAAMFGAPAMLPPAERRRASPVVRLTLACIEQALRQRADAPRSMTQLRSVFASDEGTGEISQQMLVSIASSGAVSPMVFTNSVLNAPSGYFSIAYRNHQPSVVVSLGMDSFAAGLVCAVTEAQACREPVLLAAYDAAMTAPMDELLPIHQPMANVWILAADTSAEQDSLGTYELALSSSMSPVWQAPAWMPPAWSACSSARGLAALALLGAQAGSLCLPFGAQRLLLKRA